MYIIIALTFIIGYIVIALEHPIKIDKTASALLTGVICWILIIMGKDGLFTPEVEIEFINSQITHHLGEIAEILFFLLGAMTIVELIDSHDGFDTITSRITTNNKVKLLWIISLATFFFSAILDNLTTAIVIATLLKKIFHKKEDLWYFGGIVVIAANAGGAWSPIGDITTIMLWIGGQITALNIVYKVFLPSLVCLLVPLLIATRVSKGEIEKPLETSQSENLHPKISKKKSKLILIIGVAGLLFVPVFKSFTHLPPFLGMLFSLSILWIITEFLHIKEPYLQRSRFKVSSIIRNVDTSTVLFFLGILLAVAGLQTAGHLGHLATIMNESLGNIYAINILVGLLSAIVDNVPLVAGAIGMYPMSIYPQDDIFWELLTYCAGTGGSALIIGSAAGVAIMGILKIDFIWYLKRITWLALLGYFAGALTFYLLNG